MVNLFNTDQAQGKGQRMGMFACETLAFSLMDPIVLCVLQINDMGWKWGQKLDWLIPAVMMPHSLICFELHFTRFDPFYLQVIYKKHKDWCVFVWATLVCRSSNLHELWATSTLHPVTPPSLIFSFFPRSISSTISPRGRRRKIWSMVAPSTNAPSRALGGSNGVSDKSEKCTYSLFMSPFASLIRAIQEHLEASCTSTHHPVQV